VEEEGEGDFSTPPKKEIAERYFQDILEKMLTKVADTHKDWTRIYLPLNEVYGDKVFRPSGMPDFTSRVRSMYWEVKKRLNEVPFL